MRVRVVGGLSLLLAAVAAVGQEEFVRGDVNSDGAVSQADIDQLKGWLGGGPTPPACFDAADVDDDGFITHADLALLVAALGTPQASATIPPPYPAPGPDPSADALTCIDYVPPIEIGPVHPEARLTLSGGAGTPGDQVAVAISMWNTVPIVTVAFLMTWDPGALAFEGVSRDGANVLPPVKTAPLFEWSGAPAEGWIAVTIGGDAEAPFPPLVEGQLPATLGHVLFRILDTVDVPRTVPIGLPSHLCPTEVAADRPCVYAIAVPPAGPPFRIRVQNGSVSIVAPSAGGGTRIVQEVVCPVEGFSDPLAETAIAIDFDTATGEGTLTFPGSEPAGLKAAFPFCFFPAQAGAPILRSLGLIHGFAMPGASNLAGLTDAPSIVFETIETYPIENPRKKGRPYNPVGRAKVSLEMTTDYPRLSWLRIDVSELAWEDLVCPPAPLSFEWCPVVGNDSLLVRYAGDYYLGYERTVGVVTKSEFFNYRQLSTSCTAIDGTFDAIPDQVGIVSVSFEPNGAAHFLAGNLPNDGRQFARGDANDDGRVDIGDAIHTISYLFRDTDLNSTLDAADTNDDGYLDIGDAVSILSYLFDDRISTMIRAPYWEMDGGRKGMDPTNDSL